MVEQAGNAIAAMLKLFTMEELEKMVENRHVKWNPKYDMMIQQELELRKLLPLRRRNIFLSD